ncbi:MAG TPA: HisA/HisF-related TIM barrel protein [Candidatus Acidoferrum sp.]|nr:HisA/HisF-related TIM barrel protein [Candidatus Acidoferrum sp.]
MLIPCIDLQAGQAVQLVHGRRRELAVADVFAQLEKFKRYAWLHIIDLDAAMEKGGNDKLVEALCKRARRCYGMKVRVGGGVRSTVRARQLVECGATQVIVGSAAFARGKLNLRFLRALNRAIGRKRIVVALDTYRGKITTAGWRRSLARQPQQVMASLEPLCAAFLCTDVDREGTLTGANLGYFRDLRAATGHPVVAAGGIKTRREVAALARIKMDAAVGMALYKNVFR